MSNFVCILYLDELNNKTEAADSQRAKNREACTTIHDKIQIQ